MSTPYRFVFAGLRHPHGSSLLSRIARHPDCRLVAVSEQHAETRRELAKRPEVPAVYDTYATMLADVPADVVATADFYGNRGPIAIAALAAGRHVLADKPVCSCLADLDRMESLVHAKSLAVGCMLDLRSSPPFHQARELLLGDEIGEVHAIQFGGQHPFFCYQRADWYLDPSTYGGAINDIAIHGIDILEWMTGLRFATVVAARNWSAFRLGGSPFRDAAQMMLTMDNGCGVLGDVSFVMPRSTGFRLPYYWEATFWGTRGILRMGLNRPTLDLAREGDTDVVAIPRREDPVPDYFDHFLRELRGEPTDLDTATILRATRKALLVQQAADHNLRDLPL